MSTAIAKWNGVSYRLNTYRIGQDERGKNLTLSFRGNDDYVFALLGNLKYGEILNFRGTNYIVQSSDMLNRAEGKFRDIDVLCTLFSEIIYEKTMEHEEVPAENHPRWRTEQEDAITAPEWATFHEWQNAATAAERTKAETDMGANALKLADKIKVGNTGFKYWYPVLTKTRWYDKQPTTGGFGTPVTPDSEFAAPTVDQFGYTWVYVRDADTATRHGKSWERKEVFIGITGYDPDWYVFTKG